MDEWTNKNMWLIFLYTVQLVISDVCTKFQNSRSSSSGEIFDKKNPICITLESERWKKEKNRKKAKLNLSTLVLFPVMHLVVLIVYTKFEDCSTHRC